VEALLRTERRVLAIMEYDLHFAAPGADVAAVVDEVAASALVAPGPPPAFVGSMSPDDEARRTAAVQQLRDDMALRMKVAYRLPLVLQFDAGLLVQAALRDSLLRANLVLPTDVLAHLLPAPPPYLDAVRAQVAWVLSVLRLAPPPVPQPVTLFLASPGAALWTSPPSTSTA